MPANAPTVRFPYLVVRLMPAVYAVRQIEVVAADRPHRLGSVCVGGDGGGRVMEGDAAAARDP